MLFRSWRVHEGGLSDHNLITYTVKLDSRRVVKARNFKRVEWHKFKRILDSQPCQRHSSTIWSTKRLEEEVKALEGRIIATLDEVAPLRQVRFDAKPQKRDNQVLSARKTLNKALKAKKSGAITSEELTAKRTEYKKAIRSCQQDNYKDFIDAIADPNQISKMLKEIGRAHV